MRTVVFPPFLLILMASLWLSAGKVHGQSTTAVLSEGSWYRFSLSEDGVYRIRYEDLLAKSIVVAPIPSSQLALYGGPSGALPELNLSEIYDLQEISIQLHDGGDALFGPGDYLLFYGQSPHRKIWNARSGKYSHETNVYSDVSYYYLSPDCFLGDRQYVGEAPWVPIGQALVVDHFLDYYLHEKDIINPHSSGREWYGERLESTGSRRDITLSLPDMVTEEGVQLTFRLVSAQPAEINLRSGQQQERIVVSRPRASGELALEFRKTFRWTFSQSNPTLSMDTRNLSSFPSWTYLDYIEVQYRRRLHLGGEKLAFRATEGRAGDSLRFALSGVSSRSEVWKLRDPLRPEKVAHQMQGATLYVQDVYSEDAFYYAFNNNSVGNITQFSAVESQNLRGISEKDYVMVVHPPFMAEAERLAEFHRSRGLEVTIVTPQQIYGEFSYGRQDPMAIRHFLRHMRQEALSAGSSVVPRYLLLFGAASYDYKGRSENNKNFVLNYQFPNGLIEGQNLSSDDLFGFLDDGESGFQSSDRLDIGIGRLPAITLDQARLLVDKILGYALPVSTVSGESNGGEWKNVVLNLADDGVTEPFIRTYEHRSDYFEPDYNGRFPEILVDKVYTDAYPLQATPSGGRYPDAKQAVLQRIEKGCLLFNYEGHSNEYNMTDEAVLEFSDVAAFGNGYALPLVFSASCSYAHYDNPKSISGGEAFLFNPRGGAIGVVASSRVAYTSPNDVFHGIFNREALTRVDGQAQRFGDIMRSSKNALGNLFALKPFVLLGDPALAIALPEHQVVTTHINGKALTERLPDTLKALSDLEISGEIRDRSGVLLEHFNGNVVISLYDKATLNKTLGNKNVTSGGNNPILEYRTQKNLLYKGRVSVTDGRFSCFIKIPKDIAYHYGYGKINYYAFSDSTDATGVYNSIVVGGFSDDFEHLAEAPELKLYLNDTFFVNGNISTSSPLLIGMTRDPYGINYSGSGVGHDIRMILDDDSRNPYILNDYFEPLPDASGRGRIIFPLLHLTPGKHSLQLKIWNIFNVSTEQRLDFEVVSSDKAIIDQLYNYPNPFRERTFFYFTHNAPKKLNRVEIRIFDMSGRLVNVLLRSVDPSGFAVEPIPWDGSSSQGGRLPQGIYLYQLRMICADGSEAIKSEKLLLLD